MENSRSQMLHSYDSITATVPSTAGTDRLLRYIPKKQADSRQVAIDIPETRSQILDQDALNGERGKHVMAQKFNWVILNKSTAVFVWSILVSVDCIAAMLVDKTKKSCIKMEVNFQRRKKLLFLSTNMAAMMSNPPIMQLQPWERLQNTRPTKYLT